MPSTKITSAEFATAAVVGTIMTWTVGAVTTQEVIAAYAHPKMRIKKIWAMCGTGTTATNLSVYNGTVTTVNANAVTVAAVGDVTLMTLVTGTDVVLESASISVTTSGATSELLIFIQFELTE